MIYKVYKSKHLVSGRIVHSPIILTISRNCFPFWKVYRYCMPKHNFSHYHFSQKLSFPQTNIVFK